MKWATQGKKITSSTFNVRDLLDVTFFGNAYSRPSCLTKALGIGYLPRCLSNQSLIWQNINGYSSILRLILPKIVFQVPILPLIPIQLTSLLVLL